MPKITFLVDGRDAEAKGSRLFAYVVGLRRRLSPLNLLFAMEIGEDLGEVERRHCVISVAEFDEDSLVGER